MKNFFQITFPNFGQKTKILAKKRKVLKRINSEVLILINFQCVIYQSICLNELYKLVESFFQISNFCPKTKFYSKE